MKRLILSVLALGVLIGFAGCVTKANYKSEQIVNANKEYNIEILMEKTMDQGLILMTVTNILTLYINNEVVLKGNLNKDESGELQGFYNKEIINVKCSKNSIFSPLSCIVHLGKKRIGEAKLK